MLHKTKSTETSYILSPFGLNSVLDSFDIDFPVDCDDEYWEHPDPEKAFKQPPNKPSKVSFFISILKLSQILAFALRTVVSCFIPIIRQIPIWYYSMLPTRPRQCWVLWGTSGTKKSS